jgi:hypothetical protein
VAVTEIFHHIEAPFHSWAFIVKRALRATMTASRSLVETATRVRLGPVEVGTDGMSTFIEGVAVVELDAPAFLTLRALYVVGTDLPAVTSCIGLVDTTPESIIRLQAEWERRGFRIGIRNCFRLNTRLKSITVILSFSAELLVDREEV